MQRLDDLEKKIAQLEQHQQAPTPPAKKR